MSTVEAIIKAFGGQVAMSKATGVPQQTIDTWAKRAPPEIPPWRRPAIIAAAAHSKAVVLTDEHVAYLRSTERTPKDPKPADEAQAA